jgi:hypothetical protein
MEIDFTPLDIIVDYQQDAVPKWLGGLVEFAHQICSTRSSETRVTEHFVVSLPEISGGLTALSIGSLSAEIDRITQHSNYKKIEIQDISLGMRVSIDCGSSGLQKVTGEITSILFSEGTPRIKVGTRWIAAKLIQEIHLLPPELGNPQIFERIAKSSGTSTNFIDYMTSTSIPIHRALLDIRATNSIFEDEFSWAFSDKETSAKYSMKSVIRPISSKQPGAGWSLVMNSSESEEFAQASLRANLTSAELHSEVTILCSGSAVLAQLDEVDSQVCFSVFGRDDRQLAATELAIRQKFEYSQPLSRNIDSSLLVDGMELITFEVPLSV